MRIVIALGGNALLQRGQPLTAPNQRSNIRIAADGASWRRVVPGPKPRRILEKARVSLFEVLGPAGAEHLDLRHLGPRLSFPATAVVRR